MLEGISEDARDEGNQESDLQQLESLFKKVQTHYKIDKVKLLKTLLDSNHDKSARSSAKNK